MTLIAEDLLLLLLDDERGTPLEYSHLNEVLGGAILVELGIAGAAVTEDGGWRGEKIVASGQPPDDPVLAEAYQHIAEQPRHARSLVTRFGKGAKATLGDRLVERGILQREERKVLGLIPHTRWPAQDVEHENAVRARMREVLTTGVEPQPREAALIALLDAIDKLPKVVGDTGLANRDLRKRAKAIAEGNPAAAAVRWSVELTNAAVLGVASGGWSR